MTEEVIKFENTKNGRIAKPCHKLVSHWVFPESETCEATLAHEMGKVAEKNGLSTNDLQHIFPAVLRILKSNSEWAK